jgi:hypothetical protein
MSNFKLERINKFLLQKQHLTDESKIDNIIQIADDLCGLHSTNLTTSYLSLFARSNTFKKTDLEHELYIDRNLGRIRGMRRTLFIESKKMIPIVHAATAELINKSFEKYMEVRGIQMDDYQQISTKILKILKGKELSAVEIRKELNSKLDIPGIIQVMSNNRLLIRGRPIRDWRDKRNMYSLFHDYFPNIDILEYNEKLAIRLLVQKYIKTYGPATENDISWWSGLTKTKIREALKTLDSQLERIQISELQGNYILFKKDVNLLEKTDLTQEPIITLLPELDPYPMGYKDRDRYLNPKFTKFVFDRSGNITATISLNGRVIGVWDTEDKPEPTMKIHLFIPIEEESHKKLNLKAQNLGKFIFDKNVKLEEYDSMIPLTERTAGGFMTPLRIFK